jgi:membrane-associated phospholipid phosphatase
MTSNTAPARILTALLCLLTLSMPAARADSPARQASNFASGTGNLAYLVAGIGLPLLSDGSNGRSHSLRVMDSLGTSLLLTEGLKALVREKRPDSDAHDSFPSGHATAAFAVATTESAMHPHQAPFWYLGAALISYSRVRLHRHYGRDVIAGAAIGFGAARLEVSSPHGLILSPLISPDRHMIGLQMTRGL